MSIKTFAELLKEQFIEVPDGVPEYLHEYTYNQLIASHTTTRPINDVVARFPWLTMPHSDVLAELKNIDNNGRPEKVVYDDGTIMYNPKREKYELWLDGRVVVRCETVGKVTEFGVRKHNFHDFIITAENIGDN